MQSCGDDYKPAEYWDIFYETLRNIQKVSVRKHAELVTNNYAVMRRLLQTSGVLGHFLRTFTQDTNGKYAKHAEISSKYSAYYESA